MKIKWGWALLVIAVGVGVGSLSVGAFKERPAYVPAVYKEVGNTGRYVKVAGSGSAGYLPPISEDQERAVTWDVLNTEPLKPLPDGYYGVPWFSTLSELMKLRPGHYKQGDHELEFDGTFLGDPALSSFRFHGDRLVQVFSLVSSTGSISGDEFYSRYKKVQSHYISLLGNPDQATYRVEDTPPSITSAKPLPIPEFYTSIWLRDNGSVTIEATNLPGFSDIAITHSSSEAVDFLISGGNIPSE